MPVTKKKESLPRVPHASTSAGDGSFGMLDKRWESCRCCVNAGLELSTPTAKAVYAGTLR